jgi:hypothetical protein
MLCVHDLDSGTYGVRVKLHCIELFTSYILSLNPILLLIVLVGERIGGSITYHILTINLTLLGNRVPNPRYPMTLITFLKLKAHKVLNDKINQDIMT